MLFAEAVKKLGERSPVAAALSSKQWSRVPVALRERAVFSARVEDARFLSKSADFFGDFLRNTVETLPNGEKALKAGGRAQFVDQLQRYAVANGMAPLDPNQRGGLQDVTSESRLLLVVDTSVKAAEDYGYWKQGQDPDLLDAFPAQRFVRVQDVRHPRPYHEAALGTVRLKTDLLFWIGLNRDFHVPWGPWGFRSGCDVEDVGREDAEETGLLKVGEVVHPVDRDFNDALQASTRSLHPRTLDRLRQQFGDQVVIDADTIRWVASAAPVHPAFDPSVDVPDALDDQDWTSLPLPPAPPRRSPVSDSVRVDKKMRGRAKLAVARALNAIAVAHDDGGLRQIGVTGQADADAWGQYQPGPGNAADAIGLRRDSPWPVYTAVHEFGHALDARLFGDGRYASEVSPELEELRVAIRASAAYAAIADYPGTHALVRSDRLSMRECFGRAYTQWVALRSGDPVLAANLARLGGSSQSWKVWDDADFLPIARAFDNLFARRNLRP